MNKKLEWIVIIFLVIVLIGLSACAPTPQPDKQPPHETKQEMNAEITKDMEQMDQEKVQEKNPGPSNFTSIADALGCVFAPATCQAKKDLGETEENKK